MLQASYPYYLANRPVYENEELPVVDKYSQQEVARVAMASPQVIDNAIQAACDAAQIIGIACLQHISFRSILDWTLDIP